MAGKKPTNKALQPTWQGIHGQTDGKQEPVPCKIAVVGVGKAGNNTTTQLAKMGITNAYTIAMHSNPQNLSTAQADQKILIDKKLTHAALEEALANMNVVFVTASLDDEIVSVASSVAEIARKNGATTVGVVTKPFQIEKSRAELVSCALTELRKECDTVVVVDRSKLMDLAPQLPNGEAFRIADQVVANMIKGIIETVSAPSLINLDFTDFRTVVKHGGMAVIGIGESAALNRAEEAVRNALKNPLLEVNCAEATGAIVHVTGDSQMTIEEANHVGEIVKEMMNCNAQVIWGANVDPTLQGRIRVTLVMTGVNSPTMLSDFDAIAPQLFNLEPYSEPEKKLPVDLNLYQLENFEA
jgi:cell division protein FtsZ